MKRFCSLLSLLLVICAVVSGCQSKPAKTVPDSSASVPVTAIDSSDMQPEAALADSEDGNTSQSTFNEPTNAAGNAPPQYDSNPIFTLEDGVLTANGDPVPKNITELDLCHAEFPDYRFLGFYRPGEIGSIKQQHLRCFRSFRADKSKKTKLSRFPSFGPFSDQVFTEFVAAGRFRHRDRL